MSKPKRAKALWVTAFPQKDYSLNGKGEVVERRHQYIKAKNRFLLNRMCAVFPKKKASQIHHMRGRLGSLLLDERFWLPTSATGHRKIHDNPEWARSKGFLCEIGEWNNAT